MIISKGRSYVFVHIPKTGGTSLSLALEARAMKDDLLIGNTPKARRRAGRLDTLQSRGRLWKHSTLADIDGLLDPVELSRMFVFTMVRNPWDRVVSYYHWLQQQSFDHPAVALSRTCDFGAFLQHEIIRHSLRASPAAAYVRDVAGTLRCNTFIRLENFAKDVSPLQDHLGFEVSLPHANTSPRAADHRAYYTAKTRAAVADLCSEDIARFGYTFSDAS